MFNECKIVILIFILFSFYTHASENVSQTREVTLNVNIKKPTCVLSTANKRIDFGEVDKSSVLIEQPEVGVVFSFSNCVDTDTLDIQFSGNYIDTSVNQLNIANCDNCASGIAIKLLDSLSKEIRLSEITRFSTTGTNKYDLHMKAKLVPIKNNITTVIPGDIKSAVTLVISYE